MRKPICSVIRSSFKFVFRFPEKLSLGGMIFSYTHGQFLLRHKNLSLVGVRGGEIPITKAWPAETLYSNICETG